jgi:cytochrome c peroxidase
MARSVLPFITVLFALGATAFGDDSPPAIPRDTLPPKIFPDRIPLGLGERPVSHSSNLTEARVNLGRKLFFDPILSSDRTIACASCHQPDHGFASTGKPRGIHGKQISRRAPTLFNRAFGISFFWDGRASSLEEQALCPIADPDEMGSNVADILKRLKDDEVYKADFDAAFGDGVTAANLGKAIASFERVLLRGDSRVDRFRQKGEHSALSAAERHGLWLYESKGRCWRCHTGPNFTDEQYHNTGVSWGKVPPDLGRFVVTRMATERGRFKTPTLRGVGLTGPYMHDGSMRTLDEVVEFYNGGGGTNPNLDQLLAPLDLTKDELHDLVAFLKAL